MSLGVMAGCGGAGEPVADSGAALARRAPVLEAPRVLATGGGPYGMGLRAVDVAFADLDGDGKIDIAAPSSFAGVGVVINKGGGDVAFDRTFPPWDRRTTRGIVTADFDGDGHADFAVSYPDTAVVLLGNGDGTLKPPASYAAPGEARAILAADVDGDGKLDVVAGNRQGVHVLRGRGDGTFEPARTSRSPLSIRSLFAADVDGNRRLELVAWDAHASFVVLRGNRDGVFEPGPVQKAPSVAHVTESAVTSGDFDGDGRVDFAFAYRAGKKPNAFSDRAGKKTQGVGVLLGAGDGTFRRGPGLRLDGEMDPCAVTAGDLDGDGRLDLAVGLANGTAVLALRGHGDGTFERGPTYGVAGAPGVLRTVDFDGDGKLDVVAVGGGVLTWLRGRGDGTFHGERVFAGRSGARRVVCEDFDGDGHQDCVVASDARPARWTTWRGDGRGAFVPAVSGLLGGDDARAEIAAVDLNGDGKLDLVSARRATVLLGRGDGGFGPPRSFDGDAGGNADRIVVGDVDGDARLDAVLITQQATGLRWLAGQGDGTLAPACTVDVGAKVAGAALADLDGDGSADLIAATKTGLVVLFGPSFAPVTRIDLAAPAVNVLAADLDGDGRPDLVAALADPGESLVLRNEGHRAFRPVARLAVSGTLAARDLDGDGIPDLVVQQGGVSVLAGNGDGTFGLPQGADSGDDGALADVDGDGRADLVLVQHGNPFLRILRNASP